MRLVCSVETVRRAESTAGVPEPVLMQRAATALALTCIDLLRRARGRLPGSRVVGLIGSGNNGGDALWALAKLAGRGCETVAIGDPSRMHVQGLAALRSAGGRVLEVADPHAALACRGADLALDGIVGIGGTGAVRPALAGTLAELAQARVPIVAVDIPSGVDAGTGEVPGLVVNATATVSFGVAKPGLLLHPGKVFAGAVTVVDIGLAEEDLEPVARVLSLADLAHGVADPSQYKYSRGVVQVTASCAAYPGAQHLAVLGARGSGVGMVALHSGPGAAPELVVANHPDVVVAGDPLFARADARTVGPGLGDDPRALTLLLAQLGDPAPLVVDASGLGALGQPQGRAALAARVAAGHLTVITPHEGEFAKLGFDLSGGRMAAAQRAASALGVVVVLKGPGTVIAAPGDRATYIDTFGGPELATAGSGDVLAGLCGGILAGVAAGARTTGVPLGWAEVAHAVARAVGLHGLAGRLAVAGSGAVTAPDIAGRLAEALLLAGRERQAP